jgi:hypothetical protein
MKHKKIFLLRTLLFIILFSISLLSFSQKDFRKGFIITNTADSISGRINFQGDIKNSEECNFQYETGRIVTFYPGDIKGYWFDDGKYYVSKYIEEKGKTTRIFAEYLVRGQKDLFYFRDNGGSSRFLLSKSDSSLLIIPYEEKVEWIDGRGYNFVSTQHIGFLKAYFSDCPTIFNNIETIKKPEMKNMISITKEYHDEVCGENSCIIYKKNKLPVRFALEPRLEITNFREFTGFFNQYGAILYVWLPQSNEKLYFKTGFLYSKPYNDISMYKIPVQFEFIFPEKFIRPKFGIGFNYYNMKDSESEFMSLAFSPTSGLLIRASESLYFDINFETDLFQFSYRTGPFNSYSLGFGLFILL